MTITLSPQLEAFVKEKVETGPYEDAEAVVREALQLLYERDEATRLHNSLVESEAQMERGESATWSPELMGRLIKEADELYDKGVRAGRDVRP